MTDIAELVALTAIEAAEHIADGQMSSVEYVGACVKRIAEVEDVVHAFAHYDPADALKQANALDERRRSGLPIGPLHGLPIAVTDIFDTADYRTECGSILLKGRQPMRDAAAVTRLRAAGAVIIGKTATTEFAYSHPSATRNPRDPERTPGGSSSGSAAAVAAGMVPLAIGSQTGGSIVGPASYCGVYGFKPSHGSVSRAGAMRLSRTLDQVGVFSRSLPDAALILESLAGYDPDDASTRPVAAAAFLEIMCEPPPMPPRLAFVRTPVWNQASAETQSAFAELTALLGESMQMVDLPEDFNAAWEDQRVIMAAELAYNLKSVSERAGDAVSNSLRELVAEGGSVSAVRYLAARAAAREYATRIENIFIHYDAIMTPATSGVAPKGDAAEGSTFCTLWSLAGQPAVSLPVLTGEDGMPLGVQLVGPRGDDARLLRTARWIVDRLNQ